MVALGPLAGTLLALPSLGALTPYRRPSCSHMNGTSRSLTRALFHTRMQKSDTHSLPSNLPCIFLHSQVHSYQSPLARLCKQRFYRPPLTHRETLDQPPTWSEPLQQ